MNRTKWVERRFTFEMPEGWMPNVLERLLGTTARMQAITSGLDEKTLTFRPQGKWSIKEQVGHLADLEELHEERIEDFLSHKEVLRAADMSNARTNAADHNERPLEELIAEFRQSRDRFVHRLEQLDDATQRYSAMHPRLNVPMRPVDLAFFTAEHDDHHLASIRELLNY